MSSINWKEIELLLSELPLKNSRIQKIRQTSYNTLYWEMYRPDIGRWYMLVECGTPYSRICRVTNLSRTQKNLKKLQRFEQFLRSNVEASVVLDYFQAEEDRLVEIKLAHGENHLSIVLRLYSGPGANVIVIDENRKILDLLFRRPGRDEISGKILPVTERRESSKIFTVRPWSGPSFNQYIEQNLQQSETEDDIEKLKQKVLEQEEKEMDRLNSSIDSLNYRIKKYSDYDTLKETADLLASSAHKIIKGQKNITITDEEGNETVITLNPLLNGGANVKSYYDRYARAKKTVQNAIEEKEKLSEEKKEREIVYLKAFENPSYKVLFSLLNKEKTVIATQTPMGVQCQSGGYLIFAGRNAKENDYLLRHAAKGNDIWLHTRDYPGGFVFIRAKRDKTVPLEVLLDAANLAVLFSKAKNSPKADLYYTHVKHLKRAKNGKQGLVLPSQEKNLTISLDRKRTDRLLNKEV